MSRRPGRARGNERIGRAESGTRCVALLSLTALVAIACGHGKPPAATQATATIDARTSPRVTSFGMNVGDLAREEAFFAGIDFAERAPPVGLGGDALAGLLGLPAPRGRLAALSLGLEQLDLTAFEAPAGRPMPDPTRSNDVWFQHTAIVVSDMDRAYARVTRAGIVPISPSPQTIPLSNKDAGGIRAFYFRDAEGHNLELIRYPPGKGDARWQDAKGALFLGLDHSGIVSSSTSRSLAFYRDLLGLHVAGETFNSGPEQEALSGVADARVRITSLRGAGGPGVELLEYEAPRDGKRFPDASAADRVHWETTIEVGDIDAVERRLTAAGVPFFSKGVVDVAPLHLGYSRAALVRDPDGHAVRLVAR